MLTRAHRWTEDHFGGWASVAVIPWLVAVLALAGFDYAQGYAIAKPMALEELLDAKTCADLIVDVPTLIYARQLQESGGESSVEDSLG